MKKTGKVWLAGAGPGDAMLLTIKTKGLLEKADVVVYDALVSPEILCLIPREKERIYVGKRGGHHFATQDEINRILLEEAKKGKQVLRLKGGDPFLFGRGGEEIEGLEREGIPYEIIPGITSALAVPAYAGIPVTHRDFVSSVHIITGHARADGTERIDYEALVKCKGTLLFLMGVGSLGRITEGLLQAGMKEDMPAAIIMNGTTAAQRTVVSTVSNISEDAAAAGIGSPSIIVVGEVAALHQDYDWRKYLPLSGRQFLVTRPKERISGLSGRLRELGAQVLELPSIETERYKGNARLKEELESRCESERWLVFTSPAGVDAFFEDLRELQMDLRGILKSASEVRFAAIGSATAKGLAQRGILADLVPENFCAKELGEQLAKEALPNAEILILRAKEGSKELLPPLLEAGLRVKDIPLYETRHQLHPWMQDTVKEMLERKKIDAVLFTSRSTVEGFAKSVTGIEFSSLTAICIGEQTAEAAAELGMQVLVSEAASIESMIETVLDLSVSGGSLY